MLQAVILHLSVFRNFVLYKSIVLSHNSRRANSLWTTIIKKMIIRLNITNSYTIKVYIFAKKCKNQINNKSDSKLPKTLQ